RRDLPGPTPTRAAPCQVRTRPGRSATSKRAWHWPRRPYEKARKLGPAESEAAAALASVYAAQEKHDAAAEIPSPRSDRFPVRPPGGPAPQVRSVLTVAA